MSTMILFMAVICYLAFAVGVRVFFRKVHDRILPGLVLIYIFGFLAAASHAWEIYHIQSDSILRLVVPVILYSLSLYVFFWTAMTTRARKLSLAFSEDLPEHIFCNGPYRIIRHPFYTSYLLAYLASSIYTRSWIVWMTSFIMMAIYIASAKKEEQKFMRSTLKQAYVEYRQKTGMFFPRLT